MKLRFPSLLYYWKGLFSAAGLGVGAYLLLPLAVGPDFAWTIGAVAIALGAGAFLGTVIAGFTLDRDGSNTKTLFVGNIAFRASNDDLRQLFAQYGTVHSVRVMSDRATRRSRGFGFVEMDVAGARAAIKALDGNEFHGRQLRVNEGNRRKNGRHEAYAE